MRFLDCFAGIGGLSLGFERAGLTCAGHVEIEPFPRAVLAKHWPGLFLHDDIRTLAGERIRRECGRIDVVAGGPPCQPASTAGKRKGADDDRWLWPEFCRIVRETGCSWFVAENPRGFLSLPDAAGVLGELAGAGFEMRALMVGAHHVGAPHRRDRVFIIGRLADAERDGWGAGGGVPGDEGRERIGRGEPSRGGRQSAGRTPAGGRAGEHGGVRWPARPGEPQHEWEEPRLLRLAHAAQPRGGAVSGEPGIDDTDAHGASEGGLADAERGRHAGGTRAQGRRPQRGTAVEGAGEAGEPAVGEPECALGVEPDGVPLQLVRYQNRNALRAAGNAIVPAVAQVIGEAIMQTEATP